MQLVYQQEENIELPYCTEATRYLAKATAEFASRTTIDLKDRYELAHAPRCDANAMQRRDIPALQILEPPAEAVEARFEQFGDVFDRLRLGAAVHRGRHRLDHDVRRKRVIIVALCG
jgi:hypothetical protein